MAQFINVWGDWDDDPLPQHKCVACDKVVFGLEGMRNHKCPKEDQGAAEHSEADAEGDHERPDPDFQV